MFSLSQLLPYDLTSKKNGALRSSLKEYQALIQIAYQAVDTIHNKDYEKFDGLVGENACEVRAIWLSWLLTHVPLHLKLFQKRLFDVDQQLKQLLAPEKINALMYSDVSFSSVITNENLDVFLENGAFFFILSFALTTVKTRELLEKEMNSIYIKERIEHKKLLQYGEITLSFANNLISNLRKLLAKATVEFVRQQALAMEDLQLIVMVSDAFTVTHNGLPCIPMFWACKTVLATAQQNQIPIILHAKFLKKSGEGYVQIDEEKLFYQVDETGTYQSVHPSDLDRAACIVQGIACIVEDSWSKSEWVSVMSGKSVIDVILAGAADHRQYPDPALDHMFENTQDPEYRIYQQRALAEGFAAENPSTFFIQHVYAALASKVFSCEEGNDESSSISEAPIYASNTVGIL